MKTILPLVICLILLSGCAANDSIFVLAPQQTMLMTGKGPGQDGAINPYYGKKSTAVIQNRGSAALSIRIEQKGELIQITEIESRTTREIPLEAGHELYFDSRAASKAKLTFKPAIN